MKIQKFSMQTKLLVTWDDTTSDSKWHDKQGIDKAKTTSVKTLGFFLSNKKRVLKIGHSITEDGDSDYTCIPFGCIRSIKDLEE